MVARSGYAQVRESLGAPFQTCQPSSGGTVGFAVAEGCNPANDSNHIPGVPKLCLVKVAGPGVDIGVPNPSMPLVAALMGSRSPEALR